MMVDNDEDTFYFGNLILNGMGDGQPEPFDYDTDTVSFCKITAWTSLYFSSLSLLSLVFED